MNVTFYNFSKRRNSTKLPTGSSVIYNCLLKEDTTTSRPQIMIKWDGQTGAPAQYNYCYIPAFGRYYWVNSWAYTDRQWVASCSVDVLATYKQQIGSSNKYVLRSASEWDRTIIDTLYTPKLSSVSTWSGTATAFTSWARSLAGGSIIIGIVGVSNTAAYQAGGISYFAATPKNYMQFLADMYSESLTAINNETYGSTIGDAFKAFSRNLLKSVSQPTQYIKSVMWYPFTFSTGGGLNLTLGGITSTAVLSPLSNPIRTETADFATYTIPQDPDFAYWKGMHPFTKLTAYIPPYGTFDIDTCKFGTCNGLRCYITTDAVSGMSHLFLKGTPISGLALEPTFAETVCKVGVPLDFSGLSDNPATLSSIIGGAAAIASGDAIGAAAGVASALQAAVPMSESRSSYGGISGDIADKYIELLSYDVPDEDISERGRPLCKEVAISSLSGYVLCADGEADCNATEDEHRELEEFLTGGFFYE